MYNFICSINLLGLNTFTAPTFMALLKLMQFSGSTPITVTSGFIVLIAKAIPANKHEIETAALNKFNKMSSSFTNGAFNNYCRTKEDI